MIFCESGSVSDGAIDNLAVFLSQARANGLPVVIAQESLPIDLKAATKYDFAPFVTNAMPAKSDSIVVLAAHDIDAPGYSRIRRLAGQTEIPCLAFGNFKNRQARITATSRLAYALTREATVINVENGFGLPDTDIPIFSAPITPIKRNRPRVGLFFPDLKDEHVRSAILQLGLSRHLDFELVSDGGAKNQWIKENGFDIPAWHPGELLPRSLAARFDVCVFGGPPISWPRFQMMFANLINAGVILIDVTKARAWTRTLNEVIAGPTDYSHLAGWIQSDILPSKNQIRLEMQGSALFRALKLPQVLADLRPQPAQVSPSKHQAKQGNVVFMPTNGVGLGHAKRCSLIADAMRQDVRSTFTAFPSCIGMLTGAGFDTMPLVGRTDQRPGHANDLLNFARLDASLKTASAFVFDGGYVFDGVMRAAADHAVPSVWVKRGLWQSSQNNNVALDRQKCFAKIIVPHEAFEELNARSPRHGCFVDVGPIVQQIAITPKDAKAAHRNLSRKLGLEGKSLVVTMLGGGVAADRRTQINAVCAHLASRDDVMHLVVVWPTATADPSWFNYPNTRVVQSIHASALIPMADLFVSAAGYNSFHEALYAQTPTIFIPQMASYMDDQRARAQAAAEREVALLVEPWELLRLTRAIDDCLAGLGDTLRGRLRALELPEPGMQAAAKHIQEVMR